MLSVLICFLKKKMKINSFQSLIMHFMTILSINTDQMFLVKSQTYVDTLKLITIVRKMILFKNEHLITSCSTNSCSLKRFKQYIETTLTTSSLLTIFETYNLLSLINCLNGENNQLSEMSINLSDSQ